MLCTLYMGSDNSQILQYPLGPWNQNYQHYCFWQWQLSPSGQMMNQQSSDSSPCIVLLLKSQRWHLTFSLMIPTNQMFEGPPDTPTDPYHQCINLPVPLLLMPIPWGMETTSQKSLIQQFYIMIAQWQKLLFGPLQKICLTNQLLYANQAMDTVSIVRNASVQKDKQSSFVWVISLHDQILWHRVGLAPGHTDDMYSGCAEAFEILAAFS